MSDPAPSGRLVGIVLPFAVVTLIWGSTWLVIRDQVGAAPPSWSVTWRFVAAAVGMFALVAVRRLPLWIGGRGFAFAAAVGVLQFAGNFNFVYRAELYLTSGIVAVFYALLLIPNSLLAWLLFRQPVTWRFVAGSAIATVGVGLLFLHEYRAAAIDPGAVLLGIALCCAGLLSAAVANVMQASPAARRVPMLSMLAWAMLAGAIVDAAIAWALAGPPALDLGPRQIGGALYLGLLGSVVTFPLYFRLIQQVGAGRAAYSGVCVPVIAMLLSTLFEDYRWSALSAAGALLALAGMAVALAPRAARQPASPST